MAGRNGAAGHPERVYGDSGLIIFADTVADGRRVLRWTGHGTAPPWRPDHAGDTVDAGDRGDPNGRAGRAANVFLAFPPEPGAGPDACADPGFRPLSARIGGIPPPLAEAVSLCTKLANLMAELHDARHVYGVLNPDTVWADEALDALRLLPLPPLVEDTLLTAERRAEIVGRQSPACLHPELGAARLVSAERRIDLHAIGAVAYWLLTGLAVPDGEDSRAALPPHEVSADIPPVLSRIVLRLLEREAERYDTAHGAALDFYECENQLRETGRVEPFALGRQDGAPRLAMPRELFGRDEAMQELVRAYEDAFEHATCLFVVGAPGIGKTRLIEAFRDRIEARGARFVRGKSEQLAADEPLLSLSQALEEMVRWVLAQPPRLRDAWRDRLRAALAGDEAVVYAVTPTLAELLGEAPAPPALPPQETRNRFVFAVLRLIKAMIRPRHPFCLFLDDMQWADDATIELLEALATDPDIRGLIFLGAYREEAVGPDHRLARAIRRQEGGPYSPRTVRLAALAPGEAQSFIAAALDRAGPEVADLARLVGNITKGNPFFMTQLLRSLAARRLITFDFAQRRWSWREAEIREVDFDLDVVGFILDRIRFLSADCQHLLAHAAVLGTSFSMRTLRLVTALDDARFTPALGEALRESVLILRATAGLDESLRDELRFGHDRIQQAALELFPADRFARIRRDVGLALLGSDAARLQPGLLSTALNNLNANAALVTDPETRLRLARLNLEAAQGASEKLAFADAYRKLEAGLAWLPDGAWSSHPALTRELHAACFRAAYQTASFERAEALYAELMRRITDPLEAADVINTRVLLDTAARRYEAAYEHAREALRQLGAPMPRRVGRAALALECLAILRRMRGRRVAELKDLPVIDDEARRKAIAVIANLLPVAYFLDPHLLIFCGMRIVNLSLRHGNAPQSATGYVILGLGLVAALGRYGAGHAWGRLAMEIAERDADPAVRAKVLVIFAGFVNFWRAGFESSQRLIGRAYDAAVSVGDHQYASYALHLRWQIGLFQGKSLDYLIAQCRRATPFLVQRGDPFEIESQTIWLRAFRALKGERGGTAYQPTLEEDDETYHRRLEAIGNQTLIAYHYAMRAKLACLFDRAAEALALSERAEAAKEALPGHIAGVDAELYGGLAAAKLLQRGEGGAAALRRTLRASLKRLRVRAANAPENFAPHRLLLEAEAEAAGREAHRALPRFDAAVEAAREGGFLDIAGLAARRAAETAEWLGFSAKVVASYAADADAHYRAWGALALVSGAGEAPGADREAPRAAAGTPRAPAGAETGAPGAVAHALSTDLDDEAKIGALLRAAAIESGLASACFLSLQDGEPALVARYAGDEAVFAETGTGLDAAPEVRAELLDLVRRSGREIIIRDAGSDPRFAAGEEAAGGSAGGSTGASAGESAGAVACVPAVGAGGVGGVLYLAAPAPASLPASVRRALRIAAAEISTTLARRRMRRSLDSRQRELVAAERRIDELDQMRAALASFVPRALNPMLEDAAAQRPERVQERMVSTMFIDIQGYTSLVENHGPGFVKPLVERRFSDFYEEILRRHGDLGATLGDAIFAVFDDSVEGGNHATRAVAAARSISRMARQANDARGPDAPELIFNIGINSGPAVVGVSEYGVGAERRRALSVVGSAINVAARIATLAKDGAILIGEDTRRLLPDDFGARPLGPQRLKNVSTPVEVFEVPVTLEEIEG